MSTDRRNARPFDQMTNEDRLVETCYVPQRYEPNYPYPLLVLFHPRGGDEEHTLRSFSAVSRRNYVLLSLRGVEPVVRRERVVGYGWGSEFARRESRVERDSSEGLESSLAQKRLFDDPATPAEVLEDDVFASIRRLRRVLHIHSERIFLIGCGEGAAVAYRLGLNYPERFAGVVAVNGWLPNGPRPLARIKDCRDLRFLIVHGEWNAKAPVEQSRRDVAMLRAGGLKVAFQSYPCAHRLTSPMLSDVDTWLIHQCTNET